MKLWIKTQDKKRILEIDNISLKGNTLKFMNQQYPFGVVLGKFRDEAKARTVLDTIFSKINSNSGSDCIYEIPEDY